MERERILKKLRAQININGHILGVAAGSGMTAKYASMGGVDFILALSAGVYRLMGRSSLASYLCYSNSNDIVMDFGSRQLLPIIGDIPVLFGLYVSDPTIHLYEYIQDIKAKGFSGINNFPSVGMIDGKFREALEEEGMTFEREVEAIRIARFMNLFTIAFVFNEEQAVQMARAGADVICAHFGLTGGGLLGAKKTLTIAQAKRFSERIFDACNSVDKSIIKMVYGGPISTPEDVKYMLQKSACEGFIGGSAFERIPTEGAILSTTMTFKHFEKDGLMRKVLTGRGRREDYVTYVKSYVDQNYMKEITLGDMALVTHLSSNYLSTIFKREVGLSFTEYLVKTRINKAATLISRMAQPHMAQVAKAVGYEDYAQFSKMFKKYMGCSPSQYHEHI